MDDNHTVGRLKAVHAVGPPSTPKREARDPTSNPRRKTGETMNAEQVDNDTIFMMLAGSHAYGMATENSDEDLRGVCIPSDPGYYVGFLKSFEQKDSGWPDAEDKVVYDLRKAVRLMTDGNPNMIDFLYVRDESVVHTTPWWDRIREHRDKFLSLKMRHTYAGYAYSQLKRIQRHRKWLVDPPDHEPTRAEFGLPENKLVSSDQLGAFQWMVARFLEESVTWFKLSEETRDELLGVNYIGAVQSGIPDDTMPVLKDAIDVSDNFIETVMLEKKYDTAKREWRSYQNWQKTRNDARFELERKYGFDTKHAAHLVRLMRMGYEIVSSGEVHVWRPDHEELLAIRRGAWSYDEVVAYAEQMERDIAAAASESPLPKAPDRVFIDELTQAIITEYVFG
jgi:predicted nucleotidyltransferase